MVSNVETYWKWGVLVAVITAGVQVSSCSKKPVGLQPPPPIVGKTPTVTITSSPVDTVTKGNSGSN